MSNDYYNPTGVPSTNAPGSSSDVRNEFDLIKTGFEKLPVVTGNPSEAVFVNAAGNALEAVTAATARTNIGAAAAADSALTGNPTAPTAAQFDNDTSISTTAFANRLGHHYQAAVGTAISGTTSLTASQSGHWFNVTANVTVTLPALSTTTAGLSTFTFRAASAFTLAGNGAESINYDVGAANTYSVQAGEHVTVTANTSSWYITMDAFGKVAMDLKADLASATFTGIAVPTAARTDNDTSAASTAFVKLIGPHFPSTGTALSTTQTLAAADAGGWFSVSGSSLTITMPTLASVPTGDTYTFVARDDFTLKGNGSETIVNPITSGNTYDVKDGQVVTVAQNSSNWYVVSDGFGSGSFAIGANGGSLPGGIQFRTGTIVSHATPNTAVAESFTPAFSNNVYSLVMTPTYGSFLGTGMVGWFDNLTTSGFNMRCAESGVTFYYFAIGN